MRTRLIFFSLFPAALAACSSAGPDRITDPNGLSGAKIQVVAEGGIAALAIKHIVSHDDRAFVYALGHLCANDCRPAVDSSSGTLTASATDSLFHIVLDQARLLSKDDYGTSRGAADMLEYTVRITTGGAVRIIVFDDGTAPEPMRRILQAVVGIVDAARPPPKHPDFAYRN